RVLDRMNDLDEPVHRARGKRAPQLLYQVARLALLARKRDQRQREKEEWHEGEQREIRDHGRQVGPAVGEELVQNLTHAAQESMERACGSFARPWMPPRRSPT